MMTMTKAVSGLDRELSQMKVGTGSEWVEFSLLAARMAAMGEKRHLLRTPQMARELGLDMGTLLIERSCSGRREVIERNGTHLALALIQANLKDKLNRTWRWQSDPRWKKWLASWAAQCQKRRRNSPWRSASLTWAVAGRWDLLGKMGKTGQNTY